MRQITFVNSLNQSIVFGPDSTYSINSLEGIDDATLTIYKQQAPFQNGETIIDELYEPRTITINGAIRKPQNLIAIANERRNILAITNPRLGLGTLYYKNDVTTYTTSAMLIPSGKIFPNKNANVPTQAFVISFECPDPYWYDITTQNISMQDTVANTTFPVTFATTLVLSYWSGLSKTITNNGDAKTPIYIMLYGPCTNPKILNSTTGEYLKVNKTMVAGDLLEINTAFGNKTVYYTPTGGSKVSAMAYLDLGSTFFQLSQGNNIIALSDDSSSTSDICNLLFTNRYVGV